MILLVPILLPLAVGLLMLLYPKKEFKSYKNPIYLLSILTMLVSFVFGVLIIAQGRIDWTFSIVSELDWAGPNVAIQLLADSFSSFILLATLLFGLLITIYSYTHLKKAYFTYLLWTVGLSSLAILTNNLVVLLLAWGGIALLLYLLILQGRPGSEMPANKTLVMVGGSDILMLVGAALIYFHARTVTISEISITLNSALPIVSYILLLIGVLTKAGAMPFHSWIVDSSEYAPISVMALLPASLDKLLGIYLLTRISLNMFKVIPYSAMSILLMVLGSITIIAAVLMALVQKNLLKLLSFHAVSQVGYMVLGIGSGVPIGIIGGIFHMLNNAIYKTALFLCAGAVQHRTDKTSLEKLGGLARYMPITFVGFLISAFAISGIPPLNGFASKWLIYQGVIELSGNRIVPVFFVLVAMFGSVLTLASFLKVMHSVFLGEKSKEITGVKETGFGMLFPIIVLAGFSIGLGVFAQYPIRYLFNAVLGYQSPILGFWSPTLATGLILAGIIIGFIIYLFRKQPQIRASEVFIGGEIISPEMQVTVSLPDGGQTLTGVIDIDEAKVPGTAFYDSVKKIKLLDDTYQVADTRFFDVFEQAKRFINIFVRAGKTVHNGLLHNYLGWLFLGFITIVAIFFAIRYF